MTITNMMVVVTKMMLGGWGGWWEGWGGWQGKGGKCVFQDSHTLIIVQRQWEKLIKWKWWRMINWPTWKGSSVVKASGDESSLRDITAHWEMINRIQKCATNMPIDSESIWWQILYQGAKISCAPVTSYSNLFLITTACDNKSNEYPTSHSTM